MLGLGTKEIVIIAAIVVLLFGAKKVPDLARGIGEAIRHIRGGFKDGETDSDQNSSQKKK